MAESEPTRLPALIARFEPEILAEWLRLQSQAMERQRGLISDVDLRRQATTFLSGLRQAAGTGEMDTRGPQWAAVRAELGELSVQRARQGFSPTETATFVFSLKQPLFTRLRTELANNAQALADETWRTSLLLDGLGLYIMEVYQKGREEVINRQQEELLELSTPVVRMWTGVLALPLIGTLDSARTQIVMENLLEEIVKTGASVAIIDITGVPTVDTLVAQHLLKTVAAARLMGADCIISGIRPQIAQTIVHLGVDLGDVVTKSSLADALKVALQRTGWAITPIAAPDAD